MENVINMVPEEQLLAAFWICLRNDLGGIGCTSDSLPSAQRRLPYTERVIIERTQLQESAQEFLESHDFEWWANQSGFDATQLRTKLCH